MAMRHGHEYEHDDIVTTDAIREPFGVSQIFNVALGVFFIVIGAIGLARSGLDSMTEPTAGIMGMGATPLLSLIHIAIGVVALASAVSRPAARSAATVLGAGLIAIGIIALVEGVDSLGWTGANGAAYLVSGSLALLMAMLTPFMVTGERRVTRSRDYAA